MKEPNKISFFTAILMSINIIIGVGIFIVPSLMAQQVGNLSYLGWPLVGLVFFPVVYSIAQITKFFPGQGNFYNYSQKTINKTAGFISGWFYFLGFASITAIQFIGLREFLINQFDLFFLKNTGFIFNIAAIAFFCLINIMSMFLISKVQNTATIFKLIPLFFVIFLLFFYWNPNLQLNWSNWPLLKFTLPLTLFGFWGFETSCNIGHLIKGDKNTPSKVILISFFSAIAIYTLFHFAILHIMNADNLIIYQAPGFINFLNFKNPIFMSLLSSFMSTTILITYLSAIFGGMLSNSSNFQSLLTNDLLPFSKKLKRTNRFGRPKYAVWLTGLTIFILLTLINNKVILNSVCNFGLIISFGLTLSSLLIIQIKNNVKYQKIMTLIAFLSCGIIAYYSWILMGNNNTERLLYLSPLAIFGGLGIIVFKYNESKKQNI